MILDLVAQEAESWAIAHGLVMKSSDHKLSMIMHHAPVTIIPSAVPKKDFLYISDLIPAFNILIDRISRDYTFVSKTLNSVAQVDAFTRRLLEIFEEVHQKPHIQPISLGINRIDFMLDKNIYLSNSNVETIEYNNQNLNNSSQLFNDKTSNVNYKLIELNTIASAFGCLSSRTSLLHKYLIKRFLTSYYDISSLPNNDSARLIAYSMSEACKLALYDHQIVLFVVLENDCNIIDQKLLEYELWQRYKIKTIRKTLLEISEQASVDIKGNLCIQQEIISLTYFRAGYSPLHYPTEREWEARLLIELSNSIKCPTIGYQLAGTKRIQQELSCSGVIDRFCFNDSYDTNIANIMNTMVQQWNFEGNNKDIVSEIALSNPFDFVLKPQREGGGNNYYGIDIPHIIRSSTHDNLNQFTLMKRIRPPTIQCGLLQKSTLKNASCVNELGFFGTYIGNSKTTFHNSCAGFLVRTKETDMNEGGVSTGYSVLDSPMLVDRLPIFN